MSAQIKNSNKYSESFAGNVSILAFSSISVQLLTILAFPVTSRLFKPEAFGIMAAFISITGILVNVASFRYELALVLPGEKDEAAHVFTLGFLITFIVTAFTVLIIALFGRTVLILGNVPELIRYMWLFPVTIFFTGYANLFNYWYIRLKAFREIATVRLISKISHVGSAIGFGFLGYTSAFYLITAAIIFQISATFIYLFLSLRYFYGFITRKCSISEIVNVAKKYIKFPLYSSWSDLLNVASQSVPIILITAFFGTAVAGFYSRALALVHVPFFFLSTSIRDVFFQRVSEKKSAGENISDFIESITKRLVSIILLPMLLLILISTDLFVIIAGERWLDAGVYTRLLIPWMCVGFISFPLSVLFPVMNLQDIQLVYNIFLFIARVAALCIGGIFIKDEEMTILLFSGVGTVFSLWMIFYLMTRNNIKFVKFISYFVLYFSYSLPFLVIAAFGKWWMKFPPLFNILSCFCLSLLYFFIVIRRDSELREFVSGFFKINL